MKTPKLQFSGVQKRRLLIRVLLFTLMVVLGFVLQFCGRGRTLLLDNKSTPEGLPAFQTVRVQIPGEKPLDLVRLERAKVEVMGAEHTIELTNEKGEKRSFTLNLGNSRTYLVSLPALWSGAETARKPEPFRAP